MPNTPGAIGQGITALYAPTRTPPAARKLAETLLGALGQTIWVKREAQVDAATAVSGSGPAYVFLLVEALTAAGVAQGIPARDAARFARQTVVGAGALLAASKSEASELRRNVTSPGGTTEAALSILMDKDGLARLMARAVAAATARARELSA
jgi:pyrroline-5-carboxylate reductase